MDTNKFSWNDLLKMDQQLKKVRITGPVWITVDPLSSIRVTAYKVKSDRWWRNFERYTRRYQRYSKGRK